MMPTLMGGRRAYGKEARQRLSSDGPTCHQPSLVKPPQTVPLTPLGSACPQVVMGFDPKIPLVSNASIPYLVRPVLWQLVLRKAKEVNR